METLRNKNNQVLLDTFVAWYSDANNITEEALLDKIHIIEYGASECIRVQITDSYNEEYDVLGEDEIYSAISDYESDIIDDLTQSIEGIRKGLSNFVDYYGYFYNNPIEIEDIFLGMVYHQNNILIEEL